MQLEIRGEQKDIDRFRSIWGQYVNGFNGRTHCLACLKGRKEARIRSKMTEHSIPLQSDYEYFYFFAMGEGDRRLTNVHLPVKQFPGGTASVGSAYGVTFTITDAIALRIDRIQSGWRNLPDAMTSCRNFQFGVQVFGESTVQTVDGLITTNGTLDNSSFESEKA